jgi:flagellar biosynthesis protein FlhG
LIVVNGRPARADSACRLAAQADAGREIIVLAAPTTETITASYAHIKRLARTFGQQEFRLLVNRASGEDGARRLFNNVARTAKENINALVRYGGFIPPDPALALARTARQTIFASRPDGSSAQAFDQLAATASDWAMPEFHQAHYSQANH